MAAWFKETLKQSVLSQTYVDQNKIDGIDIEEKDIKDKIYAQYLKAYEKGVYDFIKEDYDPITQDLIPRKYFSGGMKWKIKDKLNIQKDMPSRLSARGQERLQDFAQLSTLSTFSILLDKIGQTARSVASGFRPAAALLGLSLAFSLPVDAVTPDFKQLVNGSVTLISMVKGVSVANGESITRSSY